MKEIICTYVLSILIVCSYSQSNNHINSKDINGINKYVFWKLTSFNGELNLNGAHWNQETNRDNSRELTKSSFISGGLFINTRSYFWHPNFLAIDLDVGYSPETGQRLSLVTPNRNEVNTLKKLHTRAVFFQDNGLNVTVFANLNERYNNRENLTNLKSNFKNWGSTFNYNNKFLPVSFSYSRGKSTQKETQTERSYISRNSSFEAKANKSFGLNDQHEFVFAHNEYRYEDIYLITAQEQKSNIIDNKINSFVVSSNFFFDHEKNYNFNSRIINENQYGNFGFDRFQALENFSFKLPKNFRLSGNYDYSNMQGDLQGSKQNNVRSILSHKLFESLRTNVSYEFNNIKGSTYKERINRAGIGINYVKKIPLKGVLSLSYNFTSNWQNRESEDGKIFVQREDHFIEDGRQVLLNNQNVDIESVIVTDLNSTVIYTLNLDYVLIQRNEFLEIQRIPGGLIANNTSVLIDYSAIQPLSYQFNSINNSFGSSISFFGNTIELYYNITKQHYIDPINIDLLTLNTYNKNVVGIRFRRGIVHGGIEYDNYNSTIIPYQLSRYYLGLQGNVKRNLNFAIEGDISNYHMIVEEGQKQKYYNINGIVSYRFTPRTSLHLEAGYRKQEGDQEGINLDLITSRLEFSTSFRRLFFTTGLELYNKEITNEKIDFRRVTVEISRKF